MSEKNKAILTQGNAAIIAGNHEGFLELCTEDTERTFVGEATLKGKEAVRRWMAATYKEPPQCVVEAMIADGDSVVALGEITTKDEGGNPVRSSYCDVWWFRDGKIAKLRAFVIEAKAEG